MIQKSGAPAGASGSGGAEEGHAHLADVIEEQTERKVLISGDPCFGACDVDMQLALEVDLMLRLGDDSLRKGRTMSFSGS